MGNGACLRYFWYRDRSEAGAHDGLTRTHVGRLRVIEDDYERKFLIPVESWWNFELYSEASKEDVEIFKVSVRLQDKATENFEAKRSFKSNNKFHRGTPGLLVSCS